MRLLPSSRRLLPHAFLGAAIACMPLPEWLPCHADGASGSDSQSAVLADSDGDGVDDSMDCRPVDATTWSVPSEARSLALHGGAATTFTWSGPASPGASMPLYDLIRSTSGSNFASAICLVSNTSSTAPAFTDPAIPSPAFFYLVRSKTACGGSLGTNSSGLPRTGVSCSTANTSTRSTSNATKGL